MSPNIIKILNDRNELAKRINEIMACYESNDFKTNLTDAEMLSKQLDAMVIYIHCLDERILNNGWATPASFVPCKALEDNNDMNGGIHTISLSSDVKTVCR